jgi:hypothetical protein
MAEREPLPYRLDRVRGEVVFEHTGREFRLRPTMEATMEIEQAIGSGIEMVRTRAIVAGVASAGPVSFNPSLTPTTQELGTIFCAGVRAGGDLGATPAGSAKLIWEIGRARLMPALVEFLWACSDGGRLRAEDLGNAASPSGSQPEPSGEDESQLEAVIERLQTGGPRSVSS